MHFQRRRDAIVPLMDARVEVVRMSAAAGIDSDLEDKFETARDVMHTAEPGDEVLFGDRKVPLTVEEVHGEAENRTLVLEGPQGGSYEVEENYYGSNGAPNYRTSDGSKSANDLRYAGDVDSPDWTSFVNEMRSGGAQPPEMGPAEPQRNGGSSGTTPTSSGFARFDVDDRGSEIDVDGFNFDYGVGFDAEYTSAPNGMVLREFDLSGHLDGQDPFDLAEEVSAKVEEETDTLVAEPAPPGAFPTDVTEEGGSPPYDPTGPTVEDGQDDTRDPPLDSEFEFYRPPETPDDAEVTNGDDYVWQLTDDVTAEYGDLLESTDVPESEIEDAESVLGRFFGGGVDEPDTWTFADELLAFNHDVPKTVNNWHLVDYGVITDEFVDNARKMAWYNFESEELLVLAAINAGDGPEWMVYKADNDPDPDDAPLVHTEDPDEAISVAKSELYGDAEQTDLSVEEDPNGDITVRDAISDTNLAQKIMSVKGADPFGLRSYARSTSTGEFILDADNTLFDTLALARNKSSDYASRVREFFSQHHLEIARAAKLAILKALVGVSRRITGLDVSPVIKYGEIGLVCEYKYTPDDDEEPPVVDLTVSTRPILRDVKLGVAYIGLVEVADFMRANRWTFPIPGPDLDIETSPKTITKDGEEVEISWPHISVGTERAVTTQPTGGGGGGGGSGSSFETASGFEDLAQEHKNRIRPQAIDEARLDELLREYEDDEAKQTYITQLASLAQMEDAVGDVSEYDGPNDQDFREPAGQSRVAYRDVYSDYDMSKNHLPWPVAYETLRQVEEEGKTLSKALDAALDDKEQHDTARSDDFEDYHIAGSGDMPDSLKDEGEAEVEGGEDLHPDHDPSEKPEDDIKWGVLDAEERDDLNRVLDKLDRGVLNPSELTPDQTKLLRRAEVDAGVFSRDEAQFLQELDTKLTRTPSTEPNPDSGGSPVDTLDTDEIEGLSDEERTEAMMNVWEQEMMDGPEQAPENDPAEFDPDNPGDFY